MPTLTPILRLFRLQSYSEEGCSPRICTSVRHHPRLRIPIHDVLIRHYVKSTWIGLTVGRQKMAPLFPCHVAREREMQRWRQQDSQRFPPLIQQPDQLPASLNLDAHHRDGKAAGSHKQHHQQDPVGYPLLTLSKGEKEERTNCEARVGVLSSSS